jgi:hypothetical protein
MGAVLIQGDKNAPEGQTFSFPVKENILSKNGTFYEGANEIVVDNEFSLSRLIPGTTAFAPLTPATVNIKGTPDLENPLFGAKIIALGLLEKEVGYFVDDLPVVVSESRPATVYLFDDIATTGKITLVPSDDVHDANGNVSSGIVDLTTNNIGHVFAAAKPNGGEFGQINSGIALLARGTVEATTQDEKTVKLRAFGEVNAHTGSMANPQALRLDPTSNAIKINSDLSNIVQNQVAMHWDSSLDRLFVGLQTTAGSSADDGTRAVALVKFINNGAIQLETIAPDDLFVSSDTTNIIGARGADQRVSIHALRTMWTSTALNYLIVVGNVGDPASTQQSVFALPLVNAGDSRGVIANKNAQPQNLFKDSVIPRFFARVITEPATTPDQMTHATDVAAQVGGGNLLAGPIGNIIVRDDTVFAYVGENTPGIYSSQAIFDASGKITAWTQWQRAAGTTDTIFGAALVALEGKFILASGATADTVNTIKRTVWSNGSPESLQPLTTILDENFNPEDGGIQGMQTFPTLTIGLNNITALAAGGIGTITLAQTGIINNNGIVISTTGSDYNNTVSFDEGIITSNVNAKTVIISGGDLTTVGPITALEIGGNVQAGTHPNSWLFVGGSDGLAVLAQEDGMGWNTLTELGNNFSGLTSGMRFMNIGDYTFVKKLIYEGDIVNYNFLYVITHSKIDRINLDNSNFATNTLDITTIATIGNNGVSRRGGFLDGIFSQALGVIATTDQLLRVGNNKDIRTITSEEDADWTSIAIGENAGAPTALYTVTTTNKPQDITRNTGGQFYVLTADVGLNQSRINRFVVNSLDTDQTVNATTVQAFDDLFVKNIPSFLLSFGEFRSNFATDGALYFATRNQNVALSPIAMITPSHPVPRVGIGNVGDRSIPVAIDFQQGTEINYFGRNPASGSWIAAGNFNTQVLE